MMRTLLLLALLVALPAAAENHADFGAAIDQAGRQRMLTQRIVKAYAQIGLDADAPRAKQQLEASLERFETQLAELKRMAPRVQAEERLARLEQAWRPFRHGAGVAVSKESARALHRLGERVLHEAQELVQHLQERAGTLESQLVNIAGRQRMLSQRLAKIYMLRVYGVDSATLREQEAAAQNEFQGALLRLQEAAENTAEIARELRAVALQWEWFRGSLALLGAQSYPLVVADASENILEQMERITGLYARLAGPRTH